MKHSDPFFILAPMDDVTDTVFRQVLFNLYNGDDFWDKYVNESVGDGEKQTEPYSNTVKGVSEPINTVIHDKSAGAPGFARWQGKTILGPDLYFTEFVNVDGLMSSGRKNLLKKLQFVETEGPLIAQLWGLKPENFEIVARQIADGTIQKELGLPSCPVHHSSGSSAFSQRETVGDVSEYGELSIGAEKSAVAEKSGRVSGFVRKQAGRCVCGFVGVDLNMGCPAKSEVKNGACSALIKNRPLAKQIIEATKRGAGTLPVSVKTRVGFSEIDMTWIEFLLGFDLDMLTIHWRTRKEMSKVPAHWELAEQAIKMRNKISPKTKIVGNGDVMTRVEGEKLAKTYGLDGIMIGRGVFHDPFVFAKRSPWVGKSKNERIELLKKHVNLFAATWTDRQRPIHTLNKFSKIYISDFDGAKEMREKVMNTNSIEELQACLTTLS